MAEKAVKALFQIRRHVTHRIMCKMSKDIGLLSRLKTNLFLENARVFRSATAAQKYFDLLAIKQNLFDANAAIILLTMDFQNAWTILTQPVEFIIRKNDQLYSQVCDFI